MLIHYLQHVPFEGLGSIATWAQKQKHEVTVTRLYKNEQVPSVNSLDWLFIMGGPMGVDDEDKYPWLVQEKQFIEQVISANKPVIGICLGAQLIADVLGAKVYPNVHKEIGWFPIQVRDEGKQSRLFKQIPSSLEVFHWHGDTFNLPQGAAWTVQSAACKYQAFVYNEYVIGLQFHLETTRQSAKQLIENCRSELVDAPFIQTEEVMLADEQRFTQINKSMEDLLGWLEQV